MPRLKLRTDKKTGQPVKLSLLSSSKLIKRGCIELTAYDNDSREPRKDEFTR